MDRPKKKLRYDVEKIMKELLAAVSESYKETGELKMTKEEFSMSVLKIRKLLITAGSYSNNLFNEVNDLYAAGKTAVEIQRITGFGKSSVNGYMSYTKALYKPEELSLNAEWINIFRNRKQLMEKLTSNMSDDAFMVWSLVMMAF